VLSALCVITFLRPASMYSLVLSISGNMPFSSLASEEGSSNDFAESEEEEEAAETVESEGGQKVEEDEEESSGQEREVGSKSRKGSGVGGVGGEEKLGCQEEEENSIKA